MTETHVAAVDLAEDGVLGVRTERDEFGHAKFLVRWSRFAEPWFFGTVKRDGCLDIPELLHLCGPEDALVFQRAILEVYASAEHVIAFEWGVNKPPHRSV